MHVSLCKLANPAKNWRTVLVQSFTAHVLLLTATSSLVLWRRRWRSPQRCYLHCTVSVIAVINNIWLIAIYLVPGIIIFIYSKLLWWCQNLYTNPQQHTYCRIICTITCWKCRHTHTHTHTHTGPGHTRVELQLLARPHWWLAHRVLKIKVMGVGQGLGLARTEGW